MMIITESIRSERGMYSWLSIAAIAILILFGLAGATFAQTYASIDSVSLVGENDVEIDASGDWQTWLYSYPCTAVEFGYGCEAVDVSASVWGSDGYSNWAYGWADSGHDNWTFWDNSSAPAMEGVTYDLEVDVRYFDWAMGAYFDDYAYAEGSLPPSGLEITSDHGDSVWWFNGENPDSTNYPTAITLTSSGGPQTQWTVYADGEFGQAVEISSSSGQNIVVTANGVGSSWEHDTRIVASVGQLPPVWYFLTARQPKWLKFVQRDGDQCPPPDLAWGWQTQYTYYIFDQTFTRMMASVPYHEEWLSEQTWDASNHSGWNQPLANNGGAGPTDNVITDRLLIGNNGPDNDVPTVECGNDTKVDHWNQGWFIGSEGPPGAGGVQVTIWVGEVNTGHPADHNWDVVQRYRGFGRILINNGEIVGG